MTAAQTLDGEMDPHNKCRDSVPRPSPDHRTRDAATPCNSLLLGPGLFRLGGGEEFFPGRELDARAAVRLAGGLLDRVDQLPARLTTASTPRSARSCSRSPRRARGAAPPARPRAAAPRSRSRPSCSSRSATRAALDPARAVEPGLDAPPSFRIVPLLSSNGSPGRATPW